MKNVFKSIKEDFKKHKYIIKAILIFIFSYFVLDYAFSYTLYYLKVKELSGPMLVILNALKNIILLFILFLIYRKDLIRDWDKFRANVFDNLDEGIKYWFLGLVGMVASNLIINFVFKGGQAGNEQAVQDYIKYLPWLMLINVGFLGPMVEELVFRKAFKDAIKNKWLFIIISGLIFGGMHVVGSYNTITDLLFIIPYSCLGFAFAAAYYNTDTIFTSITLHMIHNTILTVTSILTLL
ncbi:MAG: CPBP family intramembrane metalloprotease, partial [Bacilli bacterium]|nr:CPBP family intramembrane metalloprotease [Bacilli bacterium]